MANRIFYIFFLLISFSQLKAQHILNDATMVVHIKKGMDYTYNFEFSKAADEYTFLQQKYSRHPAYDFLMALNLYWEIKFSSQHKLLAPKFKKHLDRTLGLSEEILTKIPDDPEAVFFKLSAEAFQVLYFSERDMNSEAFAVSRRAYYTLRKGKDLRDKLVEFYFPSGMYDYFIVQYPENKPAFKPFTMFFMAGNKDRGLKDLDYTFHNAIFTKIECGYHLCNIFLKYEAKPLLAYPYSSLLVHKYPGNYFFRVQHVEALIAKGMYEDADKNIKILQNSGSPFFTACSRVFEGVIAEKKDSNYDLAKRKYTSAIELFKSLSNHENDYLSFAYAGMGRVSVVAKNKIEADKWYKLCSQIAEYSSVIKECKEYFKKKN